MNGVIIASSEKSRIGTFHKGAQILIESGREELIVGYAEEHPGCKEGINLPIRMDEQLVGVIGITGDIENVSSFGKVMQKLIEVFLVNIYNASKEEERERRKKIFIRNWLTEKFSLPAKEFETLLHNFGIINTGFYTVISCVLENPNELLYDHDRLKQIYRIICAYINPSKTLVLQNNTDFILVTTEKKLPLIFNEIEKIKTRILATSGIKLFAGVGRQYTNYLKAYSSYNESKKALSLPIRYIRTTYYVDDIINIIVADSKNTMKQIAAHRFVSVLSKQSIEEIYNFLEIYIEYNRSISDISDHLFIHKNTVQYRIQKINRLFDIDIRKAKDLIELYLVCQYYMAAFSSETTD